MLRKVGEVLLGEGAADDIAVSELLVGEDAFGLLEAGATSALEPYVRAVEGHLGKARKVAIARPAGGFAKLIPSCRILQGREIWRQHGDWIETAKPRLGPEAEGRFAWARELTLAAENEAREVWVAHADGIRELVAGGRILLLPTAPAIAPLLAAKSDDLAAYRDRVLGLTAISSLSGVPQITLPLAVMKGCPLGLSLIGGAGSDLDLLRLAERLTSDGVLNLLQQKDGSNDYDG